MRLVLMLGILMLTGCVSIPFVGGGSSFIYSNPKAQQMVGCAVGIELFTPGISLQAIPGLMRGDAARLGSTAEEGMAKCLKMLRSLDDTLHPYTEF